MDGMTKFVLQSDYEKIKAENESIVEDLSHKKIAFDEMLDKLSALQSKIDKAQTTIMYDVDGGLLSHNRDSRYDREVTVALVDLDR